jgi:hypothetical protein
MQGPLHCIHQLLCVNPCALVVLGSTVQGFKQLNELPLFLCGAPHKKGP